MRDHRYCGGAYSDHAFGAFGGTSREGLCLVSRRNMMKAGLAGIAGLSLPDLMQHRASAATAGQSYFVASVGDPAVDDRRAESYRHVGYEARSAADQSRSLFADSNCHPRRVHLRTLAQTSGDAGQVHDHPIGRLQEEQSRAEQGHANRTSRRGTARQHQRGPLPGDRIHRVQVSWCESPVDASLHGVSKVAITHRLRRILGAAIQPIHGQSGGETSRLRFGRQRYGQRIRFDRCSSCRAI